MGQDIHGPAQIDRIFLALYEIIITGLKCFDSGDSVPVRFDSPGGYCFYKLVQVVKPCLVNLNDCTLPPKPSIALATFILVTAGQ